MQSSHKSHKRTCKTIPPHHSRWWFNEQFFNKTRLLFLCFITIRYSNTSYMSLKCACVHLLWKNCHMWDKIKVKESPCHIHTWIMIALIQTLLFWFHAFFYCLFSFTAVPQVHPSLILCMKDWRVYNNRILLHFRREKREISKKQQKCFLLHKRLCEFTFSLRYRFVTHTKK